MELWFCVPFYRKERMRVLKRQARITLAGIVAVILIIVVVIVGLVVKKYTPSKEVMSLEEYYEVAEDEALVLFRSGIYEKKALYEDGVVYLDYQTVVERMNDHFYWDENENLLLCTTPDQVIKTEAGSKDYYVNKSKTSLKYPIVKLKDAQVYVAIDYVELFSDVKHRFLEKPNRLIVDCDWGTEYMYSETSEETQIRVEPDIKSEILEELPEKSRLVYVDATEKVEDDFSKVMSEEGVIGYVRNKHLNKAFYETLESDYKKEEYSHITRDYKINLVWHQIFSESQNEDLLNQLSSTKGVTTVSPTWFCVESVEGDISSLASEEYVTRAHNAGVEVWAMLKDFPDEGEAVDMKQLLSWTSRREHLTNEIISYAIQLNLDGINIDFEKITEAAAPHYIQFLRELSVKCRNNGIILSVDNYVPSAYTAYYNRSAQGEVVDYFITMAYDEHYAGSEEAGSVASITYVEDAVKNTIAEVPKERVIMGIPFFSRLWHEEHVGDEVEITSEAYSMPGAQQHLKDQGIEAEWDKETKQYYAEYTSGDGETVNKIWLEEERSMEAKMKAIQKGGVAGVACWKLGLEKESIWDVIMKYNN